MNRESGNFVSRQLLRIPAGVLTFIVFAAILWLTLAPEPLPEDEIPMFPGMDKIAHACMFGGFYFVMTLDSVTWRHNRAGNGSEAMRGRVNVALPRKLVIIFAFLAVAFGGAIELAQGAMGMGRGCDLYDFLADAAGVAVSAFLTPFVLKAIHAGSR